MTLNVELSDETAALLAAKARANGLSTEEYALQLILHDLAPGWLQRSWTSSEEAGLDQLSMDDIDSEIAAARARRRESQPQPGS